MEKELTERDISDAKAISEMFSKLSKENKNMVISYLLVLRGKEIAEGHAGNQTNNSDCRRA